VVEYLSSKREEEFKHPVLKKKKKKLPEPALGYNNAEKKGTFT
jgi:hypothetical protein